MNNLMKEFTLADQLQNYILDSGICHHFKITNELIIINFRNTPDLKIKLFLKKQGFRIPPGHLDRKYILQTSNKIGDGKMKDCSKCVLLEGCKGAWKEECKGPHLTPLTNDSECRGTLLKEQQK